MIHPHGQHVVGHEIAPPSGADAQLAAPDASRQQTAYGGQQESPQQVWSRGQGGTTLQLGLTQAPWEQTGAAEEQTFPQCPQWRASLARSTHAPPQVSQA